MSSAIAVNLSVIPPDCGADGDEAEETHSGRLERTAQVFRFPGTVIAGTAWRLELSCRLFAFTHGVSQRLQQGSGKWQKAAKKPL